MKTGFFIKTGPPAKADLGLIILIAKQTPSA
jgi:hypothetical protein